MPATQATWTALMNHQSADALRRPILEIAAALKDESLTTRRPADALGLAGGKAGEAIFFVALLRAICFHTMRPRPAAKLRVKSWKNASQGCLAGRLETRTIPATQASLG